MTIWPATRSTSVLGGEVAVEEVRVADLVAEQPGERCHGGLPGRGVAWHRPVHRDREPLASGVGDQLWTQLLGVQADVLGEALGDGEPDRFRGQHQRPVLGERPAHRAEQRLHAVRHEQCQLRVAADDQRVGEQLAHRPGGQSRRGWRDVVNFEDHHCATLTPATNPSPTT